MLFLLRYTVENGEVTITGCDSSATTVTIPSQIDGVPVTEIGSRAFRYHSSLESVRIPEGVTSIGFDAFQGCSSLTSVRIPDGVTSIEGSTFARCRSLKEVSIPNSVTGIGDYAFEGCGGLTSVSIPASVTFIGQEAFYGCRSLKDVYYAGSKEQWMGIQIDIDNGYLKIANIHCYKMFNGSAATWEEAEAFCESQGGHLATLTCQAENDCAYQVMTDAGYTSAYFGLTDKALEGDWLWITGEPLAYTNWHSGEANQENENEDYGMFYYKYNDGTWNDGDFGNSTADGGVAFICEWESRTLITMSAPEIIVSGESNKLSTKIMFGNITAPVTVTWTSSNPNVIAFGPDGERTTSTIVENLSSLFEIEFPLYGRSNGTSEITCKLSNNEASSLQLLAFEINTYRADNLLNMSLPSSRTVQDILAKQTPCQIMTNGTSTTIAAAWTAFKYTLDTADNISNSIDFAVTDKDVDSAIILNILQASSEIGLADECKKSYETAKELTSIIKDAVELKNNIKISDSKVLSDDEREKLKEGFKQSSDILESIGVVYGSLDLLFDYVDRFETVVEKISSSAAIASYSESLKTVIRTMYENCPGSNSSLKSALKDCMNILDKSMEEITLGILKNQILLSGVDIVKTATEIIWDVAKTQMNPVVLTILSAYKAGTFFAEKLFHTDSTNEQYYKMLVTLQVEALASQASDSLRQQYQKDKSPANAAAYLSSIDVLFSARGQDCAAAYKYMDVMDTALVSKVCQFLNVPGSSREDGKKAINALQSVYTVEHISASTAWIDYLETDYPDSGLEEKYRPFADQISQHLLKKKYVAACPVDVYVYNNSDELVAYVKNNQPYCNDADIAVGVIHDVKTFYFYNNAEYRMEYIGNNTGDMDLTITEYGTDEEVLRDVYFYDVPLTNNQHYEMNTDGRTLGEVTYQLSGQENKTTEPDLDTYQPERTKRTIRIVSGSLVMQDGSLFEAEAYPDEQININAYIPKGKEFAGWTSDIGTDIFENSNSPMTTIRMPNSDVKITAVFQNTVPVVCGKYEALCTAQINWTDDSHSQYTLLLTSDNGAAIPDFNQFTAWQVEYDKSGKLVGVQKLDSTAQNGSLQFTGSILKSAKNAYKLFVLDKDSIPVIRKCNLS